MHVSQFQSTDSHDSERKRVIAFPNIHRIPASAIVVVKARCTPAVCNPQGDTRGAWANHQASHEPTIDPLQKRGSDVPS